MNSSSLNRSSVLVLNSLFQPIGTLSLKKGLIAMNSSPQGGQCAARAIDVVYGKTESGLYDLNNVITFTPYTFEEWLMVENREGLDEFISTSRFKVRCPTVIITRYSKMPMRRFRATKDLLYRLQKGICGYSGKPMGIKQMSVEHKLPRSKGGKNTFPNLMVVDKEINQQRGNRPLKEVGLRPLFNHREPQSIPAAYTIKDAVHPDWGVFILK